MLRRIVFSIFVFGIACVGFAEEELIVVRAGQLIDG